MKRKGMILTLFVFLMSALSACGNASSTGADNQNTAAPASQAAAPTASEGSYLSISGADALARMESEEGYLILDVRTPEEYAEGHLPNAINIAVETLGDADLSALPDQAQTIFVYCRSGNRSKVASQFLAEQGYTNIVEIGGIKDWPGEVVTD